MRNPSRDGQYLCHGILDAHRNGVTDATPSCERFTQLFANLAQGVVYQDQEGRIVAANPAAERILGLTFERMAGLTCFDLRWKAIREDGSEFADSEYPAMVALRDGQAVCDVLMGLFHPTLEQYRWIVMNAIPNFHAGESRPFEVFTTFTDISELKRHEDALLKTKQELVTKDALLQQVVDNLPEHLFWKDRNGAFSGCNRAGAEAIGLQSPDEIVGKTDYDFYGNPADGEFFFKQDLEVMASGASLYHSLSQKQEADGATKWLDITKVPLRDGNGNVSGLLVSYEDVTDFSRVEESLRKFKQVVEQSPDAIIITSCDGNIEYVNPAFCRIYGYSPQEVLGRNPCLLKSGHTPPEEYRQLWQRVRAGQVWHGEFLNRTKDGREIWQSATVSPLFDETGEIANFLSIQEDIGVRKVMEEALRASEDKFRHLVEDAEVIVYEADPFTLQTTYISPTGETILGYPTATWLEEGFWFGHLHPEDRESVGQASFDAVRTRGEFRLEYRFVKADGNIAWIEDMARVIHDRDGSHVSLRGVMIDITERKLAERARKKAEEDLFNAKQVVQQVLDHIPQQVFWKDLDSIYVGGNAAYLDACGMASIEELRGKSDFDFHLPEFARKYRNDDRNVMRRNRPRLNYEEQGIIRNGETSWVKISKVPLHDQAGKVVGILGMFEDITDRKAMKQELADTLLQLRTILDNAQVGIAYLQEGKVNWINRRMEEMFGYKLAEISEKSPELFYPTQEDYAQIGEQSFSVLSQGKPFEIEHLMKRKNGRTFWCHMRGVAVDTRNIVKGSIWTLMDIDSRKAAEQQLLELNNSLAQRVCREIANGMEKERLLIQQARHAAMGEMIGNIAHQWRQPLSVLGLILQNIGIDYDDHELTDEALQRYIADAMQAIQQMSGTIDGFRDFFRPSRQKVKFKLRHAIEQTLDLVNASLRNRSIEVRLSGREDIEIYGHPNEFSQMLLNLIGNAKDALDERKPAAPEIAIETGSDGEYATITVRDNAGGVPSDVAEKIFDPYFTTKDKGTGIGLYMTKTIIEKHMYGAIVFRNGEQGAEFTLKLPLRNAAADDGALP